MKKQKKQDYGWNEETGWIKGDKARFEYDTETWRIVKNEPGRQRTRPIHRTWSEVLKQFDRTNPQRSQGAFCRWAGLNRGTFSSWQSKPIRDDIERWILEWEYAVIGKEGKNE